MRFLSDHFFLCTEVRFGGQKVSPLRARPKRLHYKAVTQKKKNYEARLQSWWKEEKFRGRDERIAWPERQMMLASKILHIYRVFLYIPFQRM